MSGISTPKLSPQSDLRHRPGWASGWALPRISSFNQVVILPWLKNVYFASSVSPGSAETDVG